MHIPGCQKNGAFHIGIQKNLVIHILFDEKRGPIIYLAALKKGVIWHAHPYYAIYRKFLLLLFLIEIPLVNANSVDPDQMPHSLASYLDLYYLTITVLPF